MTDIIKNCDSYFITKCDRCVLQNMTVLLQNATVITKCDVYYKLRQYKDKGTPCEVDFKYFLKKIWKIWLKL